MYYELCATWKFQIERKYDQEWCLLFTIFLFYFYDLNYTKDVAKVNEFFDEFIRSNVNDSSCI